MDDQSEQRLQLKRDFGEFLDLDHGRGPYLARIDDMLKKYSEGGPLRLLVDMNDLHTHDRQLHQRVLQSPAECLPPFQEALDELIRNLHPKTLAEGAEVQVGFVGEFGANRVSPRELLSSYVGHLVCIEGIVTKASTVRPKWVRSVHFCPANGKTLTREYRDVTSNVGLPTGANFPTKDEEGNLLETQYGESRFRDQQHLTIQELPETAPPGQLPRSAEVVLEDDLVDKAKPGDRVSIVGIYKAVPPKASGTIYGTFKSMLVGNTVRHLTRDVSLRQWTEGDMRNIKELARAPDALEQLGASLAPSIYGHDPIKKALVLLLLGGRERNLANGTHLRGDINCLMVGDPGVAKSQLLRAVMNVAPLAVSTTGRGSSGVGLTAAVTTDADTGERRLEAGAMVLADRGIVCIDEFDKMNDNDRVAIHEVMEQQTVTIAKAGIHTSLNARCSVVAAANPLYGTYDHNLSVTRNINLPDSLLSRFDLLFICLDEMDAAKDRLVADHVIGQHRYRETSGDGMPVIADLNMRQQEEDEPDGGDTAVRVKYDARLHGARVAGRKEPLTTAFLQKYIQYAKNRYKDVELTAAAMEAIGDYYAELRSESATGALPVTVRTLETIIRLSSAAAKARLSGEVEGVDVDVATGLMDYVLKADKTGDGAARRAQNQPAKRGRDALGSDDDEDDDDDGDDEGGDGAAAPASADDDEEMPDASAGDGADPRSARRRSGRRRSTQGGSSNAAATGAAAAAEASGGLSAGQVTAVGMLVADMFTEPNAEKRFTLAQVVARAGAKGLRFSSAQIGEALKQLHADYEANGTGIVPLMYEDGQVYDCS